MSLWLANRHTTSTFTKLCMYMGELNVHALKFIKGMPKIHVEISCSEFLLWFFQSLNDWHMCDGTLQGMD